MDTPPKENPRRSRPTTSDKENDREYQIDPRRKFRRRATDSLSEFNDCTSNDGCITDMSDSEEHELDLVGSDVDEETGLTGEERKKYFDRKRRKNALDIRIAGDHPNRTQTPNQLTQREADRKVFKRLLFNATLILLWYIFSLSISLYNKWMFSGDHLNFHFPLFTTSLHMVVQFLLASAVLCIFPSLRPSSPITLSTTAQQPTNRKPLLTPLFYLSRLVPCGVTTSLDIGLGNTSLRFITLTFYTMCKSSVLIFVLTFAFLFRLETPSLRLILIITTMTLGVLLMVYGETSFHLLGFTLAISASFFSGFRWALTQILLLRHPATGNPFATLFFLAPIMFITLFTIAIFAEGPQSIAIGIQLLIHEQGLLKALALLIIPGTLAFCMIAAEFTLLQRTSVVTLSICGIFKEVVTLSAAGVVFHDRLSVVNVAGLVVTMACIACYNYLKVSKMREEARRRMEKRGDDDDDDAAAGAGEGEGAREPLMNGTVERDVGSGDGGGGGSEVRHGVAREASSSRDAILR